MANELGNKRIVRLGIWHDGIALFFMNKPDVPITAWLEDHCLVVREDPHGGKTATLNSCDAEESMVYPWRVEFEHGDPHLMGQARCCLYPVLLTRDQDGLMRYRLPPNHELPWPVVRDCEGYDRSEELMRECELRRASAERHGIRMPTPPPNIQKELTPRCG